MNTPKEGKFRHIVFRDGLLWYAVALEFNIVESSDDPKLALFNLFQAVDGYISSLKKIKGLRNFSALNQKTDIEYEQLWKKPTSKKSVDSPYQVYMHGVTSV